MTAEAHQPYDDLHRLVDRLRPDQANAVRAVVLQLVTDEQPAEASSGQWPPAWFGSIVASEPNIAERSRDILREEYGRS